LSRHAAWWTVCFSFREVETDLALKREGMPQALALCRRGGRGRVGDFIVLWCRGVVGSAIIASQVDLMPGNDITVEHTDGRRNQSISQRVSYQFISISFLSRCRPTHRSLEE
jgi:hypothetical protein